MDCFKYRPPLVFSKLVQSKLFVLSQTGGVICTNQSSVLAKLTRFKKHKVFMIDLWIVLNIVLVRYIFLLQTVALLLKVVFDINISDLAKNSHFIKSLVFFVGNLLKVAFCWGFWPKRVDPPSPSPKVGILKKENKI